MGTREAMSHAALGWVKPELDQLLELVRREVEAFAESERDGANLVQAGHWLHQVRGTLQMVELYAPALVAEEMEQLALALVAGGVADSEEACATLMRGAVLLPDYLERLQDGHRDIPVVLLPLLNELRQLRGAEPMGEESLATFTGGDIPFTDEEIAHARGSLAGQNRELLNTVGDVVKEELLRVKEALDLHLRTNAPAQDLAAQIQALSSVGDTLDMMGLGAARELVLAQRSQLEQVVDGQLRLDDDLLLEVAGALLHVEATLDHQVDTLGVGTGSDDDMSAQETRRTLEVLAQEAMANFARAREHFVAFIETNWDHANLVDVPPLLDEVAGALRMLELDVPAGYVDGVSRYILNELIGLRRVPSGRQLDTLADAIASLEYYLEALKDRRATGHDILDIARTSLEALRYWPVPGAVGDDGDVPVLAQADGAALPFLQDASDTDPAAVDSQVSEGAWDGSEPVAEPALSFLPEQAVSDVDGQERDRDPALENNPDPGAEQPFALDPVLQAALDAMEADGASCDLTDNGPVQEEAGVPASARETAASDAGSKPDYPFVFDASWRAVETGAPVSTSTASTQAPAETIDDVLPEPAWEAAGRQDAEPTSPNPGSTVAVPAAPDSETEASLPVIEDLAAFADAALLAGGPGLHAQDPEPEFDTGVLPDHGQGMSEPAAGGMVAEAGEPALHTLDTPALPASDLNTLERIAPPEWNDEEAQFLASLVAEAEDLPVGTAALPSTPPQAMDPVASGFEQAILSDADNLEIREVFLEEFQEEMTNLAQLMPRWTSRPADMNTLLPVRRVFHTLKGSGRLVGARTLGEFSWCMESLLNRVRDGHRPASPAVVSMIVMAVDEVLPQLYEALRSNSPVTADLPGIEKTAARIAEGEEIFYSPTPLDVPDDAFLTSSVAAPVHAFAQEPTAQLSPIEEGTPASVDSVLLEILQAEVSTHLDTLRSWLASSLEASQPVNDRLLRAVHTMSGAFAMTDVPEITGVTAAAETLVKRLLSDGRAASAGAVAALEQTASAIARTLDALAQPHPRIPSFAVIVQMLDDQVRMLPEAVPAPLASLDPEWQLEGVSDDPSAGMAAEPATLSDDASLQEPAPAAGDSAPMSETEAWADGMQIEVLAADDDRQPEAQAGDEPVSEAGAATDAVDTPVPEDERDAGSAHSPVGMVAPLLPVDPGVDAHLVDVPETTGHVDEDPSFTMQDMDLVDIFVEEGRDLLDSSDGWLLKLRQGGMDRDILEGLQRDLHTLKGGARMAGINTIGDLAHSIESLIEAVASDRIRFQPAEQQLLDAGYDHLHRMVGVAGEHRMPALPTTLVDAIEARLDAAVHSPSEEAAPVAAAAPASLASLTPSVTDTTPGEADGHAAALSADPTESVVDVDPIAMSSTLAGHLADAPCCPSGEPGGDAPAAETPGMPAAADPENGQMLSGGEDVGTYDPALGEGDADEPGADHGLPSVAEASVEPVVQDDAVAVAAGEAQDDALSVPGGVITIAGLIAPDEEDDAAAAMAVQADLTRPQLDPAIGLAPVDVPAVPDIPLPSGNEAAGGAGDMVPFDADVLPADGLLQDIASADTVQTAEVAPIALEPLSPPVVEQVDTVDESGQRGGQEQVRVRADLLDRLVANAGEVAIYRSRLEQQLGAFRSAMAELDRTNTRLRDQLRRLDLETEAQIVARYQRENENTHHTFDPLELDRFSTLQQLSRALNESAADLTGLQGVLDDLARNYDNLLVQQSRVSAELHDGLMSARMLPFETVVPRLRRVVRQAALETHKQVRLEVEGTHGEMDRNVLDRMVAPLEHMLRNSVAHGIETPDRRQAAGKAPEGVISLQLRREGAEIVLEVSDDGAGLDREAIRRRAELRGLVSAGAELADKELDALIFASGFSTVEQVSQLAGRGVGMDVVRNEARQLGGSVDVSSEPGKGARFLLRLPQTLSVAQSVFVQIGDSTFAVPVASVTGIGRISRDRLDAGETVYRYGGEDYRLFDLGTLVGQATVKAEGQAKVPLLLVRSGDLLAAVAVDQVLGNNEVVVKPVGLQIASLPGIYGATITGDGQVVVILDVAPLVRRLLSQPDRGQAPTAALPTRQVPLVMVVDDSLTMRKVTGRVLERHNFEVVAARDGIEALERLEERVPDLMLLDIEMPRMDGYELATAMRADARFAGVPIIMITSRTGDKHRQRALEIGVQRYMGKPYQEPDLMRNVYDLLGISRVRD